MVFNFHILIYVKSYVKSFWHIRCIDFHMIIYVKVMWKIFVTLLCMWNEGTMRTMWCVDFKNFLFNLILVSI
jgi:hypothetical protein